MAGALIGANLVLAFAAGMAARRLPQPRFSLGWEAGLTVAFALVAMIPMRLEFGRHQVTFTLADAVVVAAMFLVGPVGLGVAAACGEGAALVGRRVSALKVVFNMGSRVGAATAAAAVFCVLGGPTAGVTRAWGVALVAAGCFSLVNIASVAGVLAAAEERRYREVIGRSAPTALATTLAAAPLGIITIDLLRRGALAPFLLAPLVAAVALNNRYATIQRDEHLRVERLFGATSRTARLTTFRDAMVSAAAESRTLLTGVAALCCVTTAAHEHVGVVVDDLGPRTATARECEALAQLAAAGSGESGEAAVAAVLGRTPLPVARVVFARSPDDGPVPVTLAVFRGSAVNDARRGRIETLAAFAAQASLTIGNASLYAEVEAALRRQIDLTRQKGEFVATVSHELRTPLASVLGGIQTVLRLGSRLDPQQHDRILHLAMDQGGRLRRLIEDLLLVAAAEHTSLQCEHEEFDVAGLVERVSAEMDHATRGRLRVQTSGSLGTVVSDPQRLSQILINLIDNAAKYATSGPIDLRTVARSSEVLLIVADHGEGIPVADRERIFERFVQLNQSDTRSQGGTGLGLYLCRQLANQLGARLALTETDGGGCTFVLAVPRGAPDPEDANRALDPAGRSEYPRRPTQGRTRLRAAQASGADALRPATPCRPA